MITVLIVDNHEMACEGIKAMLKTGEDIDVIGIARDGVQAVQMTDELNPDVVLMDVRMPGKDGVAACREIKAKSPDAKIVMLSIYDDDSDVFASIEAGASGFVIKDLSARDLVKAIDVVGNGRSYFHPIISQKIADKVRAASGLEREKFKIFASLTKREIEILGHICDGASNAEIAKELFISEGTVKSHVSSILRKLDKHDRTQLAIYALKKGLT